MKIEVGYACTEELDWDIELRDLPDRLEINGRRFDLRLRPTWYDEWKGQSEQEKEK